MLNQTEDAIEIHCHSLPPLLVSHLIDGNILRWPNAVIRNQTIKPSEITDHGFDQIFSIRWRGEVRLNPAYVRPTLCNYAISGSLLLLIVENHLGAGGAEHLHSCSTYTTRPACNQCYLARNR